MRRAGKIIFAAFALVVVALLFVAWWSGRESALQWLARTAMDKSNGALAISGVAGSLYGPLSIAELVFEDEDRRVVLRGLKFDWAPKDLLDRNIHVTEFAADEVESLTKKQSERDKPLASPESLELPFTFKVEPARIKSLIVAGARGRQQFNDLVFHLDYDGEIYRAALKSIEFPAGHASAELELGDSRPFSLQGKAASSGKWQEHAYSAQLNLSGTLSAVQFDANARSAEASANASGIAIPFEKFPLKRAQLVASNIDPSQFRKNLPHADINVNFTMREEDATLTGALSLDNALPGPSDGQRLPLEKVAAAFAGSAQALDLENIELALHGGGKFVGGGNYDGKTLHLDLRAHAVDLHALHSALQPTQLKGDVRIAANQKTQSLDANLAHDKFRIALAAAHDDGEVTVSQGALRAGKSELKFSGSAELATPNSFHVEAFLKRFNPADFGQFPMAELNATLNADGKREPDLRAKLDVALEDSRWRKVPLRGKADVALAGEAIDNAKVALHAGANRVELNGAFGRASDAMRFMIAAPHLGELGPPWRGSIEAHGSLRGTMTQAALDLDFNAANLKAPGDIAVNTMRAQIEGAGSLKELTAFSSLEFSARGTKLSAKTIRVGDFEGTGTVKDGVNGKVAVSLAAEEVSTPQLKLIHAKANAEGSRAAHRVSAEGAGSDLDFQAVVRGNWRDNAWEGSIERLSNKGRYPVQLLAPAKLSFSPPRFHLQHARLQLAGGRVSLDEFVMDDASIASEGSLNAFPVAYLMSFVKQEAIAGTDLVIGGDWNFKVADKIGGTMTLKRESGDVILDKDIALGLTQLEFSARAQQNRIQTALVLAGARTGMANASAEIPLKRHDKRWRIEPAESLRANIDAAMPSIAWLSALAKPGSELGGALNLKATAQGSWNNPQISAELNGERLSANFPKTKIALHEGKLRASLNAQSRLGSPDADIKLNLKASAPSYGNVSGDAQTRVTKEGDAWQIAQNAPLKLDLNAAIPSLVWANAFVKSENAVFDGALDFKATARGTFDHPQLSAELNGNGLNASLPQTEVQLTGAQLRATLHAEPRAGSPQADVKMGLNVSAPPYGNVSGEAQTRISNNGTAWAISRDAPIAASLKAEMPSLAWTRAMLPLGSAVEGSFNLQTAASGTWGKPDLSGNIRGEALKIQHADSGLNLEDGVLRATLKNSTLLLEEFTLRGGEGTLIADGSAALGEPTPVVKINFKADKLTALSRPDRVLVLSGGGDLGMKDKKFSADAKLKANRALIELPDASAPTLGKDVVVAGDSAQKPKSGDALSGVNLALEFDLGDNFIVNGKGLDAKLAGLINLSVDGKPPPTAKGTIRVTKGTYAAYGQPLTIERGIVTFSGPIDNPGLDIVAMRKNQPVEAGVAIAGTALNPRLTLVSNPVVPDTEKVSWLVLGRGLSGSNKSDLALVQAAAGALLAQGQSVSLQQRIGQATGLDEVGISGSGLEGSVLTVGKRLSSRVYLTFERGLTGASNIAKLRYSLTPRWSLETRAGSDTALDLFYTLSFD